MKAASVGSDRLRHSQSGRIIHENPWHLKFPGNMHCKGFNAECLGRIMAGVHYVDSGELGGAECPVRSFPCNERIHAFECGLCELGSCRTGDDAHPPANGWSAGQQCYFCARDFLESLHQDIAGQPCGRLESQKMAPAFKERPGWTEAERSAETGGVPDPRVGIEREMCAVNRQIVVQQQPQEPVARTGPWITR